MKHMAIRWQEVCHASSYSSEFLEHFTVKDPIHFSSCRLLFVVENKGFSTFFNLSCPLPYASHVLPMVHLPVQQNSVPFLAIHFYYTIFYLKHFPTLAGPTHFALCSCPSLDSQDQEQKSLFSFLFRWEAISKKCAETGVWNNSRGQTVLNVFEQSCLIIQGLQKGIEFSCSSYYWLSTCFRWFCDTQFQM